MNYRNSLLAMAIASGLSAAPPTHALELGTFNDTAFSIGGFFNAEGLYEKVDDRTGSTPNTAVSHGRVSPTAMPPL